MDVRSLPRGQVFDSAPCFLSTFGPLHRVLAACAFAAFKRAEDAVLAVLQLQQHLKQQPPHAHGAPSLSLAKCRIGFGARVDASSPVAQSLCAGFLAIAG